MPTTGEAQPGLDRRTHDRSTTNDAGMPLGGGFGKGEQVRCLIVCSKGERRDLGLGTTWCLPIQPAQQGDEHNQKRDSDGVHLRSRKLHYRLCAQHGDVRSELNISAISKVQA